jgi:hypothetical protein
MGPFPFRLWVAVGAVVLWNGPGLWALIAGGERAAVIVIAATSFLGALLGRCIIWIPAVRKYVLVDATAWSTAQSWLAKISNGLLVIAVACGAAYWFLSFK